MIEIIWTQKAAEDIEGIAAFLMQEDVEIANKITKSILQAPRMLTRFPRAGRRGRVPDTRELVMQGLPYILIYQVIEDQLFVLRVAHARQGLAAFRKG